VDEDVQFENLHDPLLSDVNQISLLWLTFCYTTPDNKNSAETMHLLPKHHKMSPLWLCCHAIVCILRKDQYKNHPDCPKISSTNCTMMSWSFSLCSMHKWPQDAMYQKERRTSYKHGSWLFIDFLIGQQNKLLSRVLRIIVVIPCPQLPKVLKYQLTL